MSGTPSRRRGAQKPHEERARPRPLAPSLALPLEVTSNNDNIKRRRLPKCRTLMKIGDCSLASRISPATNLCIAPAGLQLNLCSTLFLVPQLSLTSLSSLNLIVRRKSKRIARVMRDGGGVRGLERYSIQAPKLLKLSEKSFRFFRYLLSRFPAFLHVPLLAKLGHVPLHLLHLLVNARHLLLDLLLQHVDLVQLRGPLVNGCGSRDGNFSRSMRASVDSFSFPFLVRTAVNGVDLLQDLFVF